MKQRRIIAGLTGSALLIAAFSDGSPHATEEPPEDDAGESAIPQTIDPVGVRDTVREVMAGKRIAFVPISNQGFDLSGQMAVEMQRVFDMVGADFEIHDPNFDNDLMVQIIDGLINEGVDALVLHNPDVGILTEQIQAAHEAGIYVVVVNMISNEAADVFVGADVVAMGSDIADRAADDCADGPSNKVAVIDGWGTDGFSIGANAGWDPVLDERGMEVAARQQSQYDPGAANEAATAILQQNPDLCAFLTNWDVMATGVSQAVEAAGLTGTVKVYAFDASQLACQGIADGTLTATAAYHVPGMGVAAATALQTLFENDPGAGTTRSVAYIPHVVIDESNYQDVSMACYSSQ
jgi:ribose transport system substrate-binding protein